jgi:hypothetical protein
MHAERALAERGVDHLGDRMSDRTVVPPFPPRARFTLFPKRQTQIGQ